MSDDLTILASVYLDGDVTPAERAQVESSDELLAEVDRLRSVRAVMSTASAADPAPISTCERHLSSALDAWDRLPVNERTGALRDSTPIGANGPAAAGVAAMSSPPRRSSKRRRGQSPVWLGAAAAGLVLVLAGGLVLRTTVNDDDSDLSSADATADTTADVQSRTAEGGAAEAPAPAADAATESEFDGAGEEAPAGTVSNDIMLGADAPPADDGELQLLMSKDDLAIFASDAIGAPASEDVPEDATVITDVPADVLAEVQDALAPLELPLCDHADIVVGLAIYIDERVVVGIDMSGRRAVAYRQDDCVLVASAPLS